MDADLIKYGSKIMEKWPLMSSVYPLTVIVLLYLIFVKSVGPQIMKNRKAMQLKRTMIFYNIIQVFLSAYMVFLSLDAIPIYLTMKSGYNFIYKETNYLKHFGWVYFAAKISELFDTVFMVLRKKDKQISFLHVYHHTTIINVIWFFLKYLPGDHVCVLVFLNSFVHCYMYSYYFLACFGPKMQKYLMWKKYITVIQLVQFSLGMSYYFVFGIKEDKFRTAGFLGVFYTLSLMFLFVRFYKQSYAVKKLK